MVCGLRPYTQNTWTYAYIIWSAAQLNQRLCPRQTEESRAVLRWRHQEDKFCYSNVSRSGIYGRKPSEGCSLCTDRLHNGRSFCYLFLRFSLKPLFIAAPVGSCMVSHLPSRWVSTVQENPASTSTDTSGTGPGTPWCSATNEAHRC